MFSAPYHSALFGKYHYFGIVIKHTCKVWEIPREESADSSRHRHVGLVRPRFHGSSLSLLPSCFRGPFHTRYRGLQGGDDAKPASVIGPLYSM